MSEILFARLDEALLLTMTGVSGHKIPYLDGINTWSSRNTFEVAGLAMAVKSFGGTISGVANTATVGKFYDGSDAAPHAANTPSFAIYRTETQNSAVLSGNAPALWVEVKATNTGVGNPNANALIATATQFGVGDAVGFSSSGIMAVGSTVGHFAFGSSANATSFVNGNGAFAFETNTNNSTGVDSSYTGLAPFPQFVGVHAAANGANLSTAAFWGNASPAQWDTGVVFTAGAVKTTTFLDDTSSVNVLKATGAHTNGVDISGATFSGSAFKSPSFSVSGLGAVTTTFVVTPLIIGGAAASSSLVLESSSGVGTSDSIVFKTGSQVQAGIINTNGKWSIGPNAVAATTPPTFDINLSAVSSKAVVDAGSATMRLVAATGVAQSLEMDAFQNSNKITGFTAEGVLGTPTNSATGRNMFLLAGYGWSNAAAYLSSAIQMQTAEAWSNTAGGSFIEMYVTPLTTKTLTLGLKVHPSSGVSIGSVTDAGAGNLLIAGLYKSAVAPTAVSGAGPIAIGSASTINSRMKVNLNGTDYWIPASTTAF